MYRFTKKCDDVHDMDTQRCVNVFFFNYDRHNLWYRKIYFLVHLRKNISCIVVLFFQIKKSINKRFIWYQQHPDNVEWRLKITLPKIAHPDFFLHCVKKNHCVIDDICAIYSGSFDLCTICEKILGNWKRNSFEFCHLSFYLSYQCPIFCGLQKVS